MERVPTIENCQYLADKGFDRQTSHYWVKRAGQVLLVDAASLRDIEIWAIPAPLPDELMKELPKVKVEKLGKLFRVVHEVAANYSLFQLKDTLADALAYMWIQLREMQ